MAKKPAVVVPANWFQAGYFPQICAKTGEPTAEFRKATATRINPIAYVGLLFGLLGAVLVMAVATKRLSGQIPYAGGGEKSATQKKIGIYVLAASVLSFAGFATASPILRTIAGLGFVGLLVGLGFLIAGSSIGVKLELSKDKQSVTMSNVHPTFAAATTHLLQSSLAPVQQPEQYDFSAPFQPQAY